MAKEINPIDIAVPGIGFAASLGLGAIVGRTQKKNAKRAAKAHNQALTDAALESQRRINDYITQTRVDRLRSTERLARQAQTTLGNILNVTPESQSALETIASRVASGVASDQFAIDQEAMRRVAAAEAEKRNIATQAGNQMISPSFAGQQAGMAGFSQGFGLGQSFADFGVSILSAARRSSIQEQDLSQADIETQRLRGFGAALDEDYATADRTFQDLFGRVDALWKSPRARQALHPIFMPSVSQFMSKAPM